MIIGIGTDLVQIERIQNSIDRTGDRLARRVLTPVELDQFSERHHRANFLAKRFAAKEALSKALKTGIGPISWQDIQVSNSSTGSPELELSGNAQTIMQSLGGRNIQLSLSDERDYALAFVVISG